MLLAVVKLGGADAACRVRQNMQAGRTCAAGEMLWQLLVIDAAPQRQ